MKIAWPGTMRNWGFVVEVVLGYLVFKTAVDAVVYLYVQGILPPPYFHATNDTLMDWFNVAFWAHNPGAYYSFRSVYPPIAFDFLRIVSLPSCYRFDGFFARECDWLSIDVICAIFVLNTILIYLCYRKWDRRTSLMRTAGLALGLPMLFTLERGNLIIPCFTAFVLGQGPLLRSSRLKWLCSAIAVNFKPYLLLTVAGHLVRRRWRWFEGYVLAIVVVYVISWGLEGAGTPIEVANDIFAFSANNAGAFDPALYASSYQGLLTALQAHFPFTYFLGSEPIRWMELVFPAMVLIGQVGVAACFFGACVWNRAIPLYRLSAMSIAFAITTMNAGGYTLVFLIFLVFMDRFDGVGQIIAIIAAYILSISYDIPLVPVAKTLNLSWLSGRLVGQQIAINLGELARPGAILVIEYGLILASAFDLRRAFRAKRAERTRTGPAPALAAM